MTGWEQKPQVK